MSDIVTKKGFTFAFDSSKCTSCEGRCCTGESGYIYVNRSEIIAIASLLQLDIDTFAQKYLFSKNYKYSLKEVRYNDSYDCIFYDRKTNGCSIYEARPLQCRTFPFWDYFKQRVDELKLECPGILDD